jgi:hypothetical protein
MNTLVKAPFLLKRVNPSTEKSTHPWQRSKFNEAHTESTVELL